MKLSQILNEKLNSFAYVKKTIKELSDILKNGKIPLEPFYTGSKEYFVLRTKSSRKDLVNGEKSIAIIQLNGDRLNAEFKKKNVEFYLNDKNKGVGNDLFTDEKSVPNAFHYIEQVSVLIHDKEIIPVSELKEIESICKENYVPIFFFNNRDDFLKNNRHKKVTLKTPDYNYKRKQFGEIPESLKALLYFSRESNLSSVPDKYSRYLNYFVLEQNRPSYIKAIKRDLKELKHNELGNKALADLFRKADTDNIEKIVKDIAEKWKSIINKHHKKSDI